VHSSSMSYQVEEREQKDPNDVDEMPVKPDHFDRREVVRVEYASHRLNQQKGKQAKPDDHMQRVHACHAEVQKEQNLSRARILRVLILKIESRDKVLNPLRMVFEPLNDEENGSKDHSPDQEQNQVPAFAKLCGSYRQHHRQATAD